MAALNLFPARVAFVNPDGTLTPEAYRALQIIFDRVGGAFGDSGADVFGQVFSNAGNAGEAGSTLQNDVVQPLNTLNSVYADTVQPANFSTDFYSEVVQSQASSKDMAGAVFVDVVQPPSKDREAGFFTTLDVSGNASIGGTLKLSAGTVGLPSLYWSTDTTTGFYRISANNNGYAVGGAKLLDLSAASFGIIGLADLSAATSGQIKFPATKNASANVNTLDDYREGTWTPTDASGAGLGLTVADATYTRIGNICIAKASITYPATANASVARIAGLPFASVVGGAYTGGVNIQAQTNATPKGGYIASASTSWTWADATAATVANSAISGALFYVTIIYTTA